MAKQKSSQQNTTSVRPPVIAVMGHIDHGKSTLLDYIRKTESVADEAGGITQHVSAYEIEHPGENGTLRRITFLDTPGHAAFSAIRERGVTVADIAVLVVAADDGVMEQTTEALSAIRDAGLPFVVAINKIDKNGADIESTKQSLAEAGVYLEGYGGNVSWAAVSAKAGTGIPELLDLLLLTAELEELTGDRAAPAEGVVLESDIDTKRGVSATLIIKNGTLRKGQCVVAGGAVAPVRLMEDYTGTPIEEASFSMPVNVVGFSDVPGVGSRFTVCNTKKEAEVRAGAFSEQADQPEQTAEKPAEPRRAEHVVVPIIIKADVLGSLEAIESELLKLADDLVSLRIVQQSIGGISENDIRYAIGKEGTLVVGFNTRLDGRARDLADRFGVTVAQFDIIYELVQWVEETLRARRPKVFSEEQTGALKVLRVFGKTKQKQVIGGKVLTGAVQVGNRVKLMRRDNELGRGDIVGIQKQKVEAREAGAGDVCGMEVKMAAEIAPGDEIIGFIEKES